MRIMKLLTLTALAVVAGACNGISPTSPNATVSSDGATALVDAKALEGPAHGSDCRDITEVKLRTLPSLAPIKVEAVYLKRGVPARCDVAPNWSARPQGRLFPTLDPFVVKVTRTTPPSTVQVTAQAPNGAQGSIRVR